MNKRLSFFLFPAFGFVALLHNSLAQHVSSPTNNSAAIVQDTGPSLAEILAGINRSFDKARSDAQSAVRRAELDKQKCEQEKRLAEANLQTDKNNQMMQAGVNAASHLIGNQQNAGQLLGVASGKAGAERQKAKEEILAIEQRQSNPESIYKITSKDKEGLVSNVTIDTNKARAKCTSENPPNSSLLVGGTYDYTTAQSKCELEASTVAKELQNQTFTRCISKLDRYENEINNCVRDAKTEVAQINSQLSTLRKTYNDASTTLGDVAKAGGVLAAAGISTGLPLLASNQNAKITRGINGGAFDICIQNADFEINEKKRALAELENDRSQAIMQANLEFARRPKPGAIANPKPSPTSTANLALGNLGGLAGIKGADPSSQAAAGTTGGAGGGAPGAAAAGGGGSGGGGAGDAKWTFSKPGQAPDYGPPQEKIDSLDGSGGGGAGAMGALGTGLGDKVDPFASPTPEALAEDSARGPAFEAFGDGGIQTLINKARIRLAEHIPELVKTIERQPTNEQKNPELINSKQ